MKKGELEVKEHFQLYNEFEPAWDAHDPVSKKIRNSEITSLNKIVGPFNECSYPHGKKKRI